MKYYELGSVADDLYIKPRESALVTGWSDIHRILLGVARYSSSSSSSRIDGHDDDDNKLRHG
jgi:hypothetical protein